MLLALLLAAAPAVHPERSRGTDEQTQLDYDAARAELAAQRLELAARYAKAPTALKRSAVLSAARAALLTAFDEQLFPAWAGTPWDFYGTTQTPREGNIACGYLVSTLMEHAGFKVPRVKMAQQASEYIVRSLAEPDEVMRFHDVERPAVLERLRAKLGEGLFVVGMDFHVGFLRVTGKEAKLCHAAFFEPKQMLCEDAATSAGFESRYHVIGKVFADVQLEGWLKGRDFPIR
jgi:hypothetical protein